MLQKLPGVLRGVLNGVNPIHAANGPATGRLSDTAQFGSNPGQLRMLSYIPARATRPLGLVVVLHGCGQTAAGYDTGAGWSTLADRYGFAVLMPEQNRSNNPNGCFNWFHPEDTRRGSGEVESISQMIAHMTATHGIDARRVFITGLSAGGAMTSAMLACYPELFAAGAIIAGLPYGAASTMQQALKGMYQAPARPAEEWAALVRQASNHRGSWPRVSVWHGSADTVVVPRNAPEIVKQWTALHGLPSRPSHQDVVDGHVREVWMGADGGDAIESYSIAGMAHGTPLATGNAVNECGAAGPFLLDVGISSSHHIAKFFGLTGSVIDVAAVPAVQRRDDRPAAPSTPPPRVDVMPPTFPSLPSFRLATRAHHDEAPTTTAAAPPQHSRVGRIDVGAVITQALQAAGLMKR